MLINIAEKQDFTMTTDFSFPYLVISLELILD